MAVFKNRAKEQPIVMAVIMFLFALSCIFCPTDFLGESQNATRISSAILRFIFAGLGIFFMVRLGFAKLLLLRCNHLKAVDVFLVALIIVLNNFPIVPLAQNTVQISSDGFSVFLFVLQCFSVGLFEEVFFRGLIFTLLLCFFSDTKRGQFFSIVVSSVVFGLTHLTNLLGGASFVGVLAQIGYSFLIGAMLSMVLLFNRCIVLPIVLHSLFNIGGLMVDSLGQGEIWTSLNISLTVALSICAMVYLSVRFVKSKKNAFFQETLLSFKP